MTNALHYHDDEHMMLVTALLAAVVSWAHPDTPLELLERVDPRVAEAARGLPEIAARLSR